MAHAAIGHANDLPVIGLQHDAHVEHPGTVAWPDRLPIAAAWQHCAAEAFTFEPPTGNDTDATVDPGSVPDIDRRLHVEQENEQRADAQLSHLLRQNFGKGTCGGHRRSPVWTRSGRCQCGGKTSQSRPGRRAVKGIWQAPV